MGRFLISTISIKMWRREFHSISISLILIFLFAFTTLMMLHPVVVEAVSPSDSGWYNLYNITGVEDPEIVRLSPDGSLVCIHDREGYMAELWDVKNETRMTGVWVGGVVTDIEFCPNGTMIAIGRGPGFESTGLVIFSSSNGSEIPGTHVPTNYTDDLDWSTNGNRIALGTWEGEIFIIDTTTWEIIAETRFMDAGHIVSLAFSPDDTLLAFLSSNGTCTILESDTLEWVADLERTTNNFLCELSWSFDGRYLCCPIFDGDVAVYNASTFSVEKIFQLSSARSPSW